MKFRIGVKIKSLPEKGWKNKTQNNIILLKERKEKKCNYAGQGFELSPAKQFSVSCNWHCCHKQLIRLSLAGLESQIRPEKR